MPAPKAAPIKNTDTPNIGEKKSYVPLSLPTKKDNISQPKIPNVHNIQDGIYIYLP